MASPKVDLTQLQGGWWSAGAAGPTADFGIWGDKVWLDIDSEYHPCRIEGDLLVFELGPQQTVKNRIVEFGWDRLVLEEPATQKRRTLMRTDE